MTQNKKVTAPTFIPYCFLLLAFGGWLWSMSRSARIPTFGASLVGWSLWFLSPLVSVALAVGYFPDRRASSSHRWAFWSCVIYSTVVIVAVGLLMAWPSMHQS